MLLMALLGTTKPTMYEFGSSLQFELWEMSQSQYAVRVVLKNESDSDMTTPVTVHGEQS